MTKFLVAGLSGALFLGSCASSGADEMAEKARAVFKKNQSSVVTVQLVVKSKMGFAGVGGDSRESKQEVSGTVIDPSGLTAVSLSSTDPTSLLQGFMSGFGGDGEDNFKLKMDSELSDVKLLSQDGTELPASESNCERDISHRWVVISALGFCCKEEPWGLKFKSHSSLRLQR